MPFLLLFSVFVVATCGLIYELVAGTLASYLLGDSVTQFSIIIGVYLFSMGVGSYLSKYVDRNLIGIFIQVEILVGLVGGCSSSILFLLFEHVSSFRILLYLMVFITGALVGLEIPLLMRILKNRFEFKDLVSQVFTFDYIGALLASVIFPLVLIPYMGLIKTSFFFGILNVAVALVVCVKFEREITSAGYLKGFAVFSLMFLLSGFLLSEKIMDHAEAMSYNEKVIYSKTTHYQRIVLTKNLREFRLYLNGNLQFSSADEYRYHEALVHPGLQAVATPKNILILGGGDGLAVREVLKYPVVHHITLVDLDPEMTRLFSSHEALTRLNQKAFSSSKVSVINQDAFLWMKDNNQKFDFIIVDFPDPSNYSIGKLYSHTFYKLLYKNLHDNGFAVIQSTSPYVAPKSFWCIESTLQSAGFNTLPYHAHVPSFGDWGFIIAGKNQVYSIPYHFIPGLRFVSTETMKQMAHFPSDMAKQNTAVNKLNNQALVHYFEDEWEAYLQ